MKVTRQHAEKVLEAIKAAFPAYVKEFPKGEDGRSDYDADLVPITDPQRLPFITEYEGHFEIVWEDGSPYGWTYNFPQGGVDEEFGFPVKDVSEMIPRGVYVEPMNGYSVGVFPS